ncbi:uncharacterized protein A4U43_C08F18180 [Asparagus officinalis]|nr:uncharacterized protein A4U43_C08F18180 [Asparagus officinalis]
MMVEAACNGDSEEIVTDPEFEVEFNGRKRLDYGWLIDESSPGRETTTPVVDEDTVGPSTNPKTSRHPGKEPIGMDDDVEGRAVSDQLENGADRRILEDIPSVGIHQALQACLARGTS